MENMPVFRSNNNFLGSNRRVDANELMFFTNELTAFDPKQYDILRSPLTAFSVFHEKEIDKYQTIYTYAMFEGFGKSKYAAVKNGQNNDVPFVGAGGKQYSSVIADVACALAFSDGDILASSALRRDIVGSLRRQAMRSNFELMNTTCFFGYKELGLAGLFNNPYVAAPTKTAVDWFSSTVAATDVYKDLTTTYNSILTISNNLIYPNIMLISPGMYNIINTLIFNTYNGITVKTQFETAQNIKIVVAPELTKAFNTTPTAVISGGTKDGFVIMNNDRDFIEHVMAEPFEAKPLQAVGLEYISYCVSRHGGLVVRQPSAIAIVAAR